NLSTRPLIYPRQIVVMCAFVDDVRERDGTENKKWETVTQEEEEGEEDDSSNVMKRSWGESLKRRGRRVQRKVERGGGRDKKRVDEHQRDIW
ncbi:hypothetical protein GBF38_005557, partial [Nibea albiflora]